MRPTTTPLLALLLALGLLSATVPVHAGSASSPEVPDDANDVAGQLATGAQSGNPAAQTTAEKWADIAAVWYDGENQTHVTVNFQVVELPPTQDQQLPGQPQVTYVVAFQTHSVSAEDVPGFEENLFIDHTVQFTPAVNGPADQDACSVDNQAATVERDQGANVIRCTITKSSVAPDDRNDTVYPGDMLMNHSVSSTVNLGSPPLTDQAQNFETSGFFFFQQTSDRPEPRDDDDGTDGDGNDAAPPPPESTPGFGAAALVGALGAAAWVLARRRRPR